MKIRVLVLGALGFLGREVCKLLNETSYEIFVHDMKYNSSLKNLHTGDISDPKILLYLLDTTHPDAIINLAAKIQFSGDISEFYGANILAPAIISEYCKRNSIYLIQASTIQVHGSSFSYYSKNTPFTPDTSYGKSKLIADELIASSGCDYSIIRFAGIFGFNGPNHLGINNSISKAIQGFIPDLKCKPTVKRNYNYVKDAAKALVSCLENNAQGVYYLGGEINSFDEMLTDICDVFISVTEPKIVVDKQIEDQIVLINEMFDITDFKTLLETTI